MGNEKQMFTLGLLVVPGQTLKMQTEIAIVIWFPSTSLTKWTLEWDNIMHLSPGSCLKMLPLSSLPLLSIMWHLQLEGPSVVHTTQPHCNLPQTLLREQHCGQSQQTVTSVCRREQCVQKAAIDQPPLCLWLRVQLPSVGSRLLPPHLPTSPRVQAVY